MRKDGNAEDMRDVADVVLNPNIVEVKSCFGLPYLPPVSSTSEELNFMPG